MAEEVKGLAGQAGEVCLVAKGISKQYPGTLALDAVDFTAYKGQVNVLVGENGAGKSTLMKIIAGVEQYSSGSMLLEGEELCCKTTTAAEAAGVGIIHQELNLLPNLTVYQNIFMAREVKKGGLLDNRTHIEKTRQYLAALEHPIDPCTPVRQLRVGQQQIIEIAKTMAQERLRVLIMDEPTSSLSNEEVEVLFKIIKELKAQGICIIYISHRMDEILRIGDNITVLRDGKLVAQRSMEGVDLPWIVQAMMGKSQSDTVKAYTPATTPVVLQVDGLSLPDYIGGYHFRDVSFALRQGRILGVYGMLGSGRTELLETLMGLHKEYTGDITLKGKRLRPKNINEQIKNGFALVPEDRQREGHIKTMSIAENMTLSSLKKHKQRGTLSTARLKASIRKTIEELHIKVANPKLPILSLSGGNQQKVIIGKGLLTNPQVLLLDEPSKGIDIGAKAEVFDIIRKCAAEGLAIMVVSSELKEIISISDEILVLCDGCVTAFLQGEEISEENLMRYATATKGTSMEEEAQ